MKAYKGFNKDMTCRGFQYEEGKTYETDKTEMCSSGFHACENPLDCFNYYAPGKSVYHEVEIDDNGQRQKDDTKVVGNKIKIGAQLSIPMICKLHFEYVTSKCDPAQSNVAGDKQSASAGNYGAASAGNYGAASAGYNGAASAGYNGAVVSRGSVSIGKNGAALVRGNNVIAKGGIGSILVLCEEENNYNIKDYKVIVIDGENYKADIYYTIKDGDIVEVK